MSDALRGAVAPAAERPPHAADDRRPGDQDLSEQLRPRYRSMPDQERAALWRQRLHEAEAGLTRFLVARSEADGGGSGVRLTDWFALQAEIFADLPDPTTGGSAAWQRIFFRGQALMERFLVTRFGEEVLGDWARANAQVYRLVEPDHGRGAADPIHRIARQAELYGSDYEVDQAAPADRAALTITHCAIWDYREQARRGGVRLTLASPCTYCTEALSANISAKGYRPDHSLRTGPTGHGCHWEASTPGPAQASAPAPAQAERSAATAPGEAREA
ncbi:hypothetical protein [Streptacidiphilus cavernicola]|uniref:Uncharacterized protein n=1 Tax=Streptacidiphilus cavernicola TaxID=3342716 RepID=A0ABV6VPP1_9ACTN